MAENLLRLFDCSMTQQDALTDVHEEVVCRALSVHSDPIELNDHKILQYCSAPGKLLINKDDHLLSRCMLE